MARGSTDKTDTAVCSAVLQAGAQSEQGSRIVKYLDHNLQTFLSKLHVIRLVACCIIQLFQIYSAHFPSIPAHTQTYGDPHAQRLSVWLAYCAHSPVQDLAVVHVLQAQAHLHEPVHDGVLRQG